MAKRSYEQFCPVARSLDLLGERWTLLIVRELLTGPQRYSDLRDNLPGMWSNLLAQRLRDLETAGIVQRAELPPPAARRVYELTERGRALESVLHEMARWGLPLLDIPTPDQALPPHLIPQAVQALVKLESLPDRPLTILIVTDMGAYTLTVGPATAVDGSAVPLVSRVHVDESRAPQPDVTMRTALPIALSVRRGDLAYGEALTAGGVSLEGAPEAVAETERLFGFRESTRISR